MNRCAPTRRGRRRAFAFLDVTVALGLLGLVAFATVSAVGRQRMAAHKLADSRAAARLAEDALTTLRVGGEGDTLDDRSFVTIDRLPDPAPPGYAWTRAVARVGDSEAQVTGLVPSAPREGGKP